MELGLFVCTVGHSASATLQTLKRGHLQESEGDRKRRSVEDVQTKPEGSGCESARSGRSNFAIENSYALQRDAQVLLVSTNETGLGFSDQ
jgi:hypothetical protein